MNLRKKDTLPPDHPFARFTLPNNHAPLRMVVKVDGKIIDILVPVEYWNTDILDRFPSVAELQEKGYGFYHTKDFPKCLDLSKLIVFRPASEVFLGLVIKLYEGAEHHAK